MLSHYLTPFPAVTRSNHVTLVMPVIDRDMISGLTGTGTEIINLPGPGPGPIISILPGPGPGPTIQFDRDDRDDGI